MPALRHDVVLERWADFAVEWRLSEIPEGEAQARPADLQGLAPRLQIRRSFETREVLVEASAANGLLEVDDPASGIVLLDLPAAATAALPADAGVLVYDLVLEGDGVQRVVEGHVTLSPGVTR